MSSNPASMDRGLVKCGQFRVGHRSRRLERFHFWRDRLVLLEEAVEEATPPSKALLKALRDSKKSDRWLNSWIAVVAIGLTHFFGLVQSVEGAVQVYKAYHPEADSPLGWNVWLSYGLDRRDSKGGTRKNGGRSRASRYVRWCVGLEKWRQNKRAPLASSNATRRRCNHLPPSFGEQGQLKYTWVSGKEFMFQKSSN
jgi:hypothetical protein